MLVWSETSCQWQDISIYWNGRENCQTWSNISCFWNKIHSNWNAVEVICAELFSAELFSGGQNDDGILDVYDKLDDSKKRKLIRIILYINNVKIDRSQYVDVDKYQITIEDIRNLFEIYGLNKKKEDIKINVSEINVR